MNFPDLDRITIAPDIMGGKPCIRGMRVTAGMITGLVASVTSFSRNIGVISLFLSFRKKVFN